VGSIRVECQRERHRYAGLDYGFMIEVLRLRCASSGRSLWEVLIVSERWATGAPENVIRSAKWMKFVAGRSSELRDWIRRHRPSSVGAPVPGSLMPLP
jgi:hypothetical protein